MSSTTSRSRSIRPIRCSRVCARSPIRRCRSSASRVQLRDLCVGRPGIANVSIAFPTGVMRGTFFDRATGRAPRPGERVPVPRHDARTNYGFDRRRARGRDARRTNYDPRTRPHWHARDASAKQRVWMPPRTFFTSHKTGLTVAEPIYDARRRSSR